MTARRRLAKLESALTPTQLVLRWVDEAHAYGSFEAYTKALLDAKPEDVPLNRLCREAQRVARAAVRSRLPEQIDQAVLSAVRDTAFRFYLVLRITVTADELMEKEQTVIALAPGNLVLFAGTTEAERRQEIHGDALNSIAQLLFIRADELEAAARARALAEKRYLDGRPVLFPVTAALWDEQLHLTRQLAAIALGLAELDGIELAIEDETVVAMFVDRMLADLVAWAKVTALEKIGEGEHALAIARNWLRPQMDRAEGEAPTL